MEMRDALAALAALAHGTRLAVYRRLVEAGADGCVAGDLAQELEVPAATLSFHLKELAHATLIEAEPQGRFMCYRANFATMTQLLGYLTENCCAGGMATCVPAVACGPVKRRS
jgi:ArsR family transcriptional regulator